MAHEHVRVDEGGHRRDAARDALVLRITSSHATLRRAAGTLIVPASSRKLGVLARIARLPSTRKTTSSPASIPSASRTAFGTVICPFEVTLAAASIPVSPYRWSSGKDSGSGCVPVARRMG